MTRFHAAPEEKPLFWVGRSKEDLSGFPEAVQDDIGWALSAVQFGGKHPRAKPWKGEGPGIFEIISDFRGDTYRAVYTVRFAKAIYVLHAFQKKSATGRKTARSDVDLIRQRLRIAQQDYEVRYGQE